MFSQNVAVRKAMEEFVVVSLFTDGKGARRDEFNSLREKLTQSSSNPMYVVVDPFSPDKVTLAADYNDALDEGFARKLEKASRRVTRAMKRRGVAVE